MDINLYLNKVIGIDKKTNDLFKHMQIRTIYNSTRIVSINKVPVAQINDKFFYTMDGILSFTHGHPAFKGYYSFLEGKTLK